MHLDCKYNVVSGFLKCGKFIIQIGAPIKGLKVVTSKGVLEKWGGEGLAPNLGKQHGKKLGSTLFLS